MCNTGKARKIPITKGIQYHTQGGQLKKTHTEGLAGFAAGAGRRGGGEGAAPGPLRMVYIQYIHTYNTRGGQYLWCYSMTVIEDSSISHFCAYRVCSRRFRLWLSRNEATYI